MLGAFHFAQSTKCADVHPIIKATIIIVKYFIILNPTLKVTGVVQRHVMPLYEFLLLRTLET